MKPLIMAGKDPGSLRVVSPWDFPCGAECISGRCEDRREGEPVTGWTEAAYPPERLSLFF